MEVAVNDALLMMEWVPGTLGAETCHLAACQEAARGRYPAAVRVGVNLDDGVDTETNVAADGGVAIPRVVCHADHACLLDRAERLLDP